MPMSYVRARPRANNRRPHAWHSVPRSEPQLWANFVLPARFDVHVADAFVLQAATDLENGGRVVRVDGSQVVFIDYYALEALVALQKQASSNGGTLVVVNPSLALQITTELTGHAEVLVDSGTLKVVA